jgi:hypothetical protein
LLINVQEVHSSDVKKVEGVHAAIDMGVADDGLESIFLLIACSFAVSVVLSAVLAEIEWAVFAADQFEFLEGGAED